MMALISDFIVFLQPLRGFSSSGRASGSQSEGGRFESGNLHGIKKKATDYSAAFFVSSIWLITTTFSFFKRTFNQRSMRS